MAAASAEPYAPNTPLSKIQQDESGSASWRLPAGRCNYTNLSVGGSKRCGCQRYWDQADSAITSPGRPGGARHWQPSHVCSCEHHACYHEAEGPVRILVSGGPEIVQPYSQVSKANDFSLPDTYRAADEPHPFGNYSGSTVALRVGEPWEKDLNLQSASDGRASSRGPSSQGGLANRTDSSKVPPIPSQCLLPSNISSGSFDGELGSFSSSIGLGFQSLIQFSGQGDDGKTNCERELHEPADANINSPGRRRSPNGDERPELERHVKGVQVAAETLAHSISQLETSQGNNAPQQTTSTATSNNVVALVSTNESGATPTLPDAQGWTRPLRQVIPHLQAIHKHLATRPTFNDRIENHARRLDFVENAFHNVADRQEVDERFEVFDDRQNELESRVDDIEKAQAAINEISSIGSSRRQIDLGASMVSDTSSAVIFAMSGRQELSSRLEALESKFAGMNPATLSSYANPWEVEVVYLPFGVGLKGIWSTLSQYSNQRYRQNSMAADDWTQTQFSMAKSQATRSHHRSWEDMNKEVHAQDWLVARACSAGSKIEERLRSRGLVRTIAIKGPGAREAQDAMSMAFGDVAYTLSQGPKISESSIPKSVQPYQGLQSSWIPLRKLHKDSRLRFLDPSEMVTSAVWTASFLSSVLMRAAEVNRLYVTQRDSYLQAEGQVNWTWQKLRELPRVNLSQSSSPDIGFRQNFKVQEGDAREACWEWDERLDPPPSVHSSFNSHHSSLSIRRPPQSDHASSSHSSGIHSPALSTSPTSVAPGAPLSPLLERHLMRPWHSRTSSMPAMIPVKSSTSQGKRRIASFDYDHGSVQSSLSRPPALPLKRRRISLSPGRPRDTPRWSVGPPSPYVDEPVDQKRGTTPFAYATPHSNAPYFDVRRRSTGPMIDDDEDLGNTTDANDVGIDSGMEDHQQEWEGVQDEMPATGEYSDQERKALSIDDENESDTSSKPSEYPTRQQQHAARQPIAFYPGTKGSFHIHVDEDVVQ